MSEKTEILASGETPTADYEGIDLEAMACAQNYHRWIVDCFRPYIGRTVAEIGAGCGNFSSLLLEQCEVERLCSFEPSYNMHSLMLERLGKQTRFTAFNEFLSSKAHAFEGYFDSVIYNNVMEHVPDDRTEVQLACKTLKPGGHLLIFVPALAWLYSDFDRSLGHFRRYYKRDGVELLRGAGLTIVEAKYVDLPGILPWMIFMKLMKLHLSTGKVSLYDNLVVPIVRSIESIIPPPIGKNLILIGRKP